jgi:pyridoxal phosphate enzyme (YggS family)
MAPLFTDHNILENITRIQQLIRLAESAAHRPNRSVTLLAVSKHQPIKKIQQAYTMGIHDFAENYWQEAHLKQQALADLPLTWHFIGKIQKNKAKNIARHFSWVHSLCDESTAKIFNTIRSEMNQPMNVCIQVNLEQETSKGGIEVAELPALIASVETYPFLKLRGLMSIPTHQISQAAQYSTFLQLKNLLPASCDTLSMGMSDDFVSAIKAGSTIVRIGRAIFGERALSR